MEDGEDLNVGKDNAATADSFSSSAPGLSPPPPPRNYSTWTADIYTDGHERHVYPVVTTNANKLEAQAREKLGSKAYNYVASGAGEKATMEANRLAFRQWKIIPRMLKLSTHHNLRTRLFGYEMDSPVIMAPVGVQGIFHPDKELATASVAAELGVAYCMSMASSTPMEEVAAANGDGLRFFQLYWPPDNELTLSILGRAKALGFKALIVTVDTWHLGYRPEDLDQGYAPFNDGIGVQTLIPDPVFRRIFAEMYNGKTPEEDLVAAGLLWGKIINPGHARTWENLKFLRDNWDGPLLLKGIQHAEDAKVAIAHGVDGIYVSNHGGRQLDGAIGSLDCLADIAAAVGDKTTIIFDSGVRTGADIIKALCLGAHAVAVGRPFIYGLSINGRSGVKAVMSNILADFDNSVGCAGLSSLKDCNRNIIRKVQYPGDRFSNY